MKSINPTNPTFPHTSDPLRDIKEKTQIAEASPKLSEVVTQSPAQQPVLPSATGRDVRAAIEKEFLCLGFSPVGRTALANRVLSALQPFLALPGQAEGEDELLEWLYKEHRSLLAITGDDPSGEPTRKLWAVEDAGIQTWRPTPDEAIKQAMREQVGKAAE